MQPIYSGNTAVKSSTVSGCQSVGENRMEDGKYGPIFDPFLQESAVCRRDLQA